MSVNISKNIRAIEATMVYEIKDKVVLITGAARGIGSDIIRIALDEGAKQVALIDIDEKNAVALENEVNSKHGEGKLKFFKCDVTNGEQLTSIFESVLGDKSKEYIVINCAAILNDSLLSFKKQIDINVTALINGSLKALDLMRKDKGGKGGTIVNISSTAALMTSPTAPIYSATKSAVMQFSVALGCDDYYLRTGTRVLTMCFGPTDTGLLAVQNMGCFDELMEEKITEAISSFPMQKPESAARAVIETCKIGTSGSIWLSNDNKPTEDITKYHTEAYKILFTPIM